MVFGFTVFRVAGFSALGFRVSGLALGFRVSGLETGNPKPQNPIIEFSGSLGVEQGSEAAPGRSVQRGHTRTGRDEPFGPEVGQRCSNGLGPKP